MVNILIGWLGHRAVDIVVLASVVVLVPVPILSQLMAAQGVLVLMKNFKIVNMRPCAQVCLSAARVTYIYRLIALFPSDFLFISIVLFLSLFLFWLFPCSFLYSLLPSLSLPSPS